jgi:hypothetical protein
MSNPPIPKERVLGGSWKVVLVLDYVFTVCHKEWAIGVPWQPEDLPSILHSRRILTMCKVCVKIFLCVVMAIGIDANK